VVFLLCSLDHPSLSETPVADVIYNGMNVAPRTKRLNVNKSAGVYNIHSRVLQELNKMFLVSLKNLSENSFKYKYLPEDQRTATVAPIHKRK
jgi:hypothetical protein